MPRRPGRPQNVEAVMRALARAIDGLELPAVEKISESQEEDPFQVLIATLLSARTQDATTLAASTRLFEVARTPRDDGEADGEADRTLIYPVSFYRHKARHVKATCRILVERFGGRVPTTMEELLTLPGVGRKTANLVLILAFKSLRNICVDTHVHRISNRLGWVRTRTPDETEQALYAATDAALVAVHQPVSRHVGTERLPAGVSAMRRTAPSRRCVRKIGVTQSLEIAGAGGGRPMRRRSRGVCADRLLTLGGARRSAARRRSSRRRRSSSSRRRRARSPSRRFRTTRRRPSRTSWRSSKPASTTASASIARCPASSCSSAIRRRATCRSVDLWGRGPAASSGTPIGVAEISKKRTHEAGAVGVAHMGDPAKADSQIYVTLARRKDLDGQYAVFGQVIEGEDVPGRLQVGDQIRRVYLRE